jgi:membrane protease YdiL (CAAX protease family)
LKGSTDVRGLLFVFFIAASAFAFLFTGVVFHFWFQMALTAAGLCVAAFAVNPGAGRGLLVFQEGEVLRAPVLGLFSAALLYCMFYAGGKTAAALFPAADSMVGGIYAFRDGTSPLLIACLLIIIIGPCEEIFWRGLFQKQLENRYGLAGVVLAASAYTLVHLPSGNPMLVVAAAVCGIFWGMLFHYFRSIWANIISHAAWDVAIFILWPVNC